MLFGFNNSRQTSTVYYSVKETHVICTNKQKCFVIPPLSLDVQKKSVHMEWRSIWLNFAKDAVDLICTDSEKDSENPEGK